MIYLKHNGAEMAIDPLGAELRSFRTKDGREHLWSGDPAVWKSVAPVLFPAIGFLKNGEVSIAGKPCAIPKHGFAKYQPFTVSEQGDDFITLTLTQNAETKAVYPFDFALSVTHRILQNGFETRFTVENHSSRVMPFVIGGHPGFACPMGENEQFEEYELHFEKPETGECLLCTPEHLMGDTEIIDLGADHRTLPLRYAEFDQRDTYIFPHVQSRAVELKNPRTGSGLRLFFPEMEVLAIWTMPDKHAPYVCLEPWQGLPALQNESGRFEDKPYHIDLDVGRAYSCGYRMEILGGENK